jgi:hypothetical protein
MLCIIYFLALMKAALNKRLIKTNGASKKTLYILAVITKYLKSACNAYCTKIIRIFQDMLRTVMKDLQYGAGMKTQLCLKRFKETREELNEFLFSLSDEQLKRSGHHPVFGLMSINGWTEFFLLHEAQHFFTILKLAPQISGTD